MIEIITPGLLTTVQDFGRVGVMKTASPKTAQWIDIL